jgi:hypothetical protein
MIIIPFAYAYSIFFLCAIFQHNVQEFDFGLQVAYFTMVDVKAKDFNFYFDLCVGLWQSLHMNQNMQKVFKLESFRFTIKQRRQP